ncbi:general L-amino acid transport system substrate-binding protein [Kosakonia oryzendophytica]|uniref:General L-amino acid transport system substrate-binding protein n=1 Tax=Kosakonia oryzendophytica TaxID=1005665 RepID=A0A1C4BR70_9ENTR|nr:amino acid ABC transporter substrate-binding protein [Kosakonia oryzendophytica]AMO49509.1 Extracellular solute-binding protein, family 3 precursor [Enterobacter sp. FY-07]TDT59613.1 amino acid ABC transporter substrate-binding protein (PAAT family) [Enterobacter sp. AG5470]WBT56041.1 amino acid ABC transporter substrate-binding protein [Kosakonia oryzendophytica]SCC09396.1 general L-amino acid transport system substrate-binding protein [Kosakonia oryzendophytica]
MLKKTHLAASVLLLTLGSFIFPAQAENAPVTNGDTLKKIKARGELVCGVHPARHGFASIDSKGQWEGLDVDFCRALAAAVFGDASKVRFTPLSTAQRFAAIQSGEVDVLSRNVTASLTRDVSLGLNFAPPNFYTGTGFMVRANSGVKKVEDLDGATVCITPGSSTEQNVAQIFSSRNLHYTPVVIENNKEYVAAYLAGRCDVIARDKVALPGIKTFDAEKPDDHIILPGIYSKEPLAMAVRKGDDQWFDIVKWVVYATFNAEEMNVNQSNVDAELKSTDPDVQGLLGVTGGFGQKLGLDDKWVYNIVKQVGNYGDIYNRHFGPQSTEPLDRDLNNLWTKGGLLYGLPIR